MGHKNVWIVKPAGLSCGERIAVTSGCQALLQAVKALDYKCIVQKYIEHPLLLRNNQKFDIRQWILVTSLQPLKIYGFSECYIRLSTQSYSLDDLSAGAVHLCNFAVQKHSLEDASRSGFESEAMMSQGEFARILQDRYSCVYGGRQVFEEMILPQIKAIAVRAVQCSRHKMQRVGKGFEWLGLDLMVSAPMDSSSLEVMLLEVNVSPDISLSTPITARLVTPAVRLLWEVVDGGFRASHTPAMTEEFAWTLWHDDEDSLPDAERPPASPSRAPDIATATRVVDQMLDHWTLGRTQPEPAAQAPIASDIAGEEDEI